MISERPSERAFFGASALLFAASTVATIVWCSSMNATRGMPMPGNWTMSMAWMRMPGQTWPAAAATFLGMWMVMMVAMMLPSLVPMLRRYRHALARTGVTHLGSRTFAVAAGYFAVWAVFGMAIFPAGVALATVEMHRPALARAVPFAAGVVVLIAGMVQLSAWKRDQLACCNDVPMRGGAWRHGLRLGLRCCSCCGDLTAILLVAGVMDLGVMALVTTAITLERVGPVPAWLPRATGGVVVATGVFLIVRAAGVV